MSAPTGTVWGSIVNGSSDGRKGRIGIYTKVSSTNTETTVNVQVWFWTIYSCSDGSNNFYYNAGTSVSAATTKIGSVSINHTVASGEGWSTSNQTKLIDKTYTYTRDTSAKTYKVYAKLNGIDMIPSGTMYANTSYTVPALTKYTVSYNANGGSGAPSSQTKYYGKTLTLSSTKPTRTGYSFQGWALSKDDADAGTWYYAAGGTCGKNENLTLYAVWKANTYTVSYNANGGSGAPASQTKTYGVTLKLSSTVPTRTNYNFLGWGTAATATTAYYAPGANYTANSAVTLYAIWELAYVKPRIKNISVYRCNSDGTANDSGTYARVIFDWASDRAIANITIEHSAKGVTATNTSVSASGTSGSVDKIIGAGVLSIEKTYTIRVTVKDSVDYSAFVRMLTGYAFARDFYAKGEGVAWGKPAELKNVFDIGFQTRFFGGILHMVLEPETKLNDVKTPNTYIGANVSTHNYGDLPETLTSGTFILEVISSGPSGQLLQRITLCDKNKSKTFERYFYGDAWGSWSGEWKFPAFPDGCKFTMYGTSTSANLIRYRKDGRIVEARGIVTPIENIAGSTTIYPIFVLPDGYRPCSPIYMVCQGSGACSWLLRVNTDGEVGFSRYRSGEGMIDCPAETWLPFQVTFIAN
jgi:uncharacterized repeat protein (TIGR02543 family)